MARNGCVVKDTLTHLFEKNEPFAQAIIRVFKRRLDTDNVIKYLNDEDVEIIIQVIGVRFEINDPYICVIAKLIKKDLNFILSQLQKNEIKRDCLNYAKKYQIKSEVILNKYDNKQSGLFKDLLVSSIQRQN